MLFPIPISKQLTRDRTSRPLNKILSGKNVLHAAGQGFDHGLFKLQASDKDYQ